MKSIFEYRDNMIEDYKKFSKSFVRPKAEDIKEYLSADSFDSKYWPEPLLQINPHYETYNGTVDDMADVGTIEKETAQIFRVAPDKPLILYTHQASAIFLAQQRKNYILTTGTGSGKSLAFFIPIVDYIIKAKKTDSTPKTRAIIMYPMNALANSQMEEINKFLKNNSSSNISVKRYTGQESEEERKNLANNPPDILLTNYMMLELILTRFDEDIDLKVISNCQDLKFFVADELHTYRGRQGADVALLIRRLRLKLHTSDMLCIGTSATMSSIGTAQEKKKAVCEVATKLFGTDFSESNIISETLSRMTDVTEDLSQYALLPSRVKTPIGSKKYEDLKKDPLANWLEMRISLAKDSSDALVRAKPQKLSKVLKKLEKESGGTAEEVKTALTEFLLASAEATDEKSGAPLFAFKLHQFISGPGYLLTTLEPTGTRTITCNEQINAPGKEGIPLFRTYFCRDCGQEYIPVYKSSTGVSPRLIEDMPSEEDIVWGYIVPDNNDLEYDETTDTLPLSWLDTKKDGSICISKAKKELVPYSLKLAPNGAESPSGSRYIFIPGRVGFCVSCLTEFDSRVKEQTKLAGLSGEGRSSATTVITINLLRQMFEQEGLTSKKMLGFVDNRQDAALQAGHFNDFINNCIRRSVVLTALEENKGAVISLNDLTTKIITILGFDDPLNKEAQSEIFTDFDMAPVERKKKLSTAKSILGYRILNDLRKRWRYNNPSLSHLGLLQIEFDNFNDMMADSSRIGSYEFLPILKAQDRSRLMKLLLDEMLGSYCIKSEKTDFESLNRLRILANELNPRWGFDEKEELAVEVKLSFKPVRNRNNKTPIGYLSCSPTSKIGRMIKKDHIWNDGRVKALNKKTNELIKILISELLDLARYYGIVFTDKERGNDEPYYQIKEDSLLWGLGNGIPASPKWENPYFSSLYQILGKQLDNRESQVFSFEAKEHTAQVSSTDREVLEKRFRGEPGHKPLPVLYCSPTMELGIDISSLNTVYMRNVPPTPANYAQRSGRAGRSGQPALVVTYCASLSPHDQWYFTHEDSMVSGSVVAPSIDLTNKEMIDSHLHAIWFSNAHFHVKSKITEVIAADSPYAMLEPAKTAFSAPLCTSNAQKEMQDFLATLEQSNVLNPAICSWYSSDYSTRIADTSFSEFNKAFNTWRQLVKATMDQRKKAHEQSQNSSLSAKERQSFDMIYTEAGRQYSLLVNPPSSANTASSDFYFYRYLASQGFLPGYNFPRLPIVAWIPQSKSSASEEGISQTTAISRARFLALSEFGPQSIIYHEGNQYRVHKVKLNSAESLISNSGAPQLATKTVMICNNCGYGMIYSADTGLRINACPCCGHTVSDAIRIDALYRIENVETKLSQRITSYEEERMRRGYDMQTFFSFDVANIQVDSHVIVAPSGEEIARLNYIPSAEIYKLNKGWKNRKSGANGFLIDPVKGIWERQTDPTGVIDDDVENSHPSQRIVPYAKEDKNILLFTPSFQSSSVTDKTASTLQAALLRGIEKLFQIEESEISVEPLPDSTAKKSFLFYEASEGGAGVLIRLAEDESLFGAIAKNALEIMHYSVPNKSSLLVSDLVDTECNKEDACVSGCYRCLLSYYNQMDHQYIDRKDKAVLELLVAIINGRMQPADTRTNEESDSWLYTKMKQIGILDGKKITTRSGIEVPFYSKTYKIAVFDYTISQEVISELENKGITSFIVENEEDERVLQINSFIKGE